MVHENSSQGLVGPRCRWIRQPRGKFIVPIKVVASNETAPGERLASRKVMLKLTSRARLHMQGTHQLQCS
jgi:hypothetical protein